MSPQISSTPASRAQASACAAPAAVWVRPTASGGGVLQLLLRERPDGLAASDLPVSADRGKVVAVDVG